MVNFKATEWALVQPLTERKKQLLLAIAHETDKTEGALTYFRLEKKC